VLFCRFGLAIFAVGVFTTLWALPAAAALDIKDGAWRLEIRGARGLESGGEHRDDDIFAAAAVEYEFPLAGRATLGFRLLPIFVYEQGDGTNYDRLRGYLRGDDNDTVAGGGIGIAARVYARKREHRGFFFEVNTHALIHGGEFDGNDSNVNFLSGVGLGYQFRFGMHTSVKWQHISNAGLGEVNDGSNILGVGIGFRF